MLSTLAETIDLIHRGKLLHISAAEGLLRQLPRGNWIGGSTEYFMGENGGKVTGELLDVLELDYDVYKLVSYNAETIGDITRDAYINGFSVVILPFDSEVHREYAKHAPEYDDIFLKAIVGWIAGLNLTKAGQTPIAVNGQTGEAFDDRAVALHISLPKEKVALINIVNIFSPDESGPVITFDVEGFSAQRCKVDGKETSLAAYIAENAIDTRLPLIGDYSGAGVNISIKNIADETVDFYAPVFQGISYRFALPVENYARSFIEQIKAIGDSDCAFSCNCILNFLYGELEGKDLGAFYGPVTFGEIAYQLVNQTLVYVQVL